MSANLQIQDFWFSFEDSTSALATPTLSAAEITAVSKDDPFYLFEIDQQWGTEQGWFKIAFMGQSRSGLKCTGISTKVQMAAALTGTQYPRIILPFAKLASKPASVLVFYSETGDDGTFRLVQEAVVRADAFRSNVATTDDMVINIECKPAINATSEGYYLRGLSINTDPVYGIKAYKPEVGLGDDGISLMSTPKTIDRVSNGSSSTFSVGNTVKLKIQMSATNTAHQKEIFRLCGFNFQSGKSVVIGTPERTLRPFTLSFDGHPKMAGRSVYYLPTMTCNHAEYTESKKFGGFDYATLELSSTDGLFTPSTRQGIIDLVDY